MSKLPIIACILAGLSNLPFALNGEVVNIIAATFCFTIAFTMMVEIIIDFYNNIR